MQAQFKTEYRSHQPGRQNVYSSAEAANQILNSNSVQVKKETETPTPDTSHENVKPQNTSPPTVRRKRLPLYRLYRNNSTPFSLKHQNIIDRPLKRSRQDLINSNIKLEPLAPKSIRVAGLENQKFLNSKPQPENQPPSISKNLNHGKKNKKSKSDMVKDTKAKEDEQIKKSFLELNALGKSWIRDPADIYNQHKDQKEDNLLSHFVREGFTEKFPNSFKDKSSDSGYPKEYQSAMKDIIGKIDLDRIGQDLCDIKAQKLFQNNYIDNVDCKKLQEDQFPKNNLIWIYNTHSTVGKEPNEKAKLNKFFTDLKETSIPYKKLQRRKLPYFYQKMGPNFANLPNNFNKNTSSHTVNFLKNTSEMIIRLANFNIPINRAIWYIKASYYGLANYHDPNENRNLIYNRHINQKDTLSDDPNFQKLKKSYQDNDGSGEWSFILSSSIFSIFDHLMNVNTPQVSSYFVGNKTVNIQNPHVNSDTLSPGKESSFIPDIYSKGFDPNLLPIIIGQDLLRKYWDYTIRLTAEMFNKKLLDREYILAKLVKLFERSDQVVNFPCHSRKSSPLMGESADPENLQETKQEPVDSSKPETNYLKGVKLLIPVILTYMETIVSSHFLSRKLAWSTAKFLSLIYNPEEAENKLDLKFNTVIIGLSSIMQCIVLESPSSLVNYPKFNGIGNKIGLEEKIILGGSPLDLLPENVSKLPFHPLVFPEMRSRIRETTALIKEELITNEKHIIKRSIAVENYWSCDKWRADPNIVQILNKLVHFLNFMDGQANLKFGLSSSSVFNNFNECYKSDPNNKQEFCFIVDEIYECIFNYKGVKQSKNGLEKSIFQENELDASNSAITDTIIAGLCQWAITTDRVGFWRSTLIAKLLEKRQEELNKKAHNDSGVESLPEAESREENPGFSSAQPFHNSILKFLHTAPILKNPKNIENNCLFQKLMLLMGELIRHGLFNYTKYLNMMICDNDLINFKFKCLIEDFDPGTVWYKNAHPDYKQKEKIKLFDQHSNSGSNETLDYNFDFLFGFEKPRHLQYILHMPVFGNETFDWMESSGDDTEVSYFSAAEIINDRNQRNILLYGAGKNKNVLQASNRKLCHQLTKALFRYNLPKTLNKPQTIKLPDLESSNDLALSNSMDSIDSMTDEIMNTASKKEEQFISLKEDEIENLRLNYAIEELYRLIVNVASS